MERSPTLCTGVSTLATARNGKARNGKARNGKVPHTERVAKLSSFASAFTPDAEDSVKLPHALRERWKSWRVRTLLVAIMSNLSVVARDHHMS